MFDVPRKEAGQAVQMALQPGNHQHQFELILLFILSI
jgi:hypothetical protein